MNRKHLKRGKLPMKYDSESVPHDTSHKLKGSVQISHHQYLTAWQQNPLQIQPVDSLIHPIPVKDSRNIEIWKSKAVMEKRRIESRLKMWNTQNSNWKICMKIMNFKSSTWDPLEKKAANKQNNNAMKAPLSKSIVNDFIIILNNFEFKLDQRACFQYVNVYKMLDV